MNTKLLFQVMTLETIPGSDGELEDWRAVKQYSRSSADQEIPMCYELRPPSVLMRTCTYLLHEICDTKRQVIHHFYMILGIAILQASAAKKCIYILFYLLTSTFQA